MTPLSARQGWDVVTVPCPGSKRALSHTRKAFISPVFELNNSCFYSCLKATISDVMQCKFICVAILRAPLRSWFHVQCSSCSSNTTCNELSLKTFHTSELPGPEVVPYFGWNATGSYDLMRRHTHCEDDHRRSWITIYRFLSISVKHA